MARFEIYVNDVTRAKAYYAGLFGWTFSPMAGAEAAEYHLIDGKHFGQHLAGGMMRRMDQSHAPGSAVRGGTMTFEVDDCDAKYAWALANGGGEALPPMDFPSVGRCAYVEDGEGNIVGLITPITEGA
jgi:uncharacterized protein